MIWSEEARSVIAEDRRREDHDLAVWEDERRAAYDRDFDDADAEVTQEAQALFEWAMGLRP